MSWKRYSISYRLRAPLHIGAGRVGNLQRTRRYVPGKNVWAAFTSALTQASTSNPSGPVYDEVGKKAASMFRFGYLFPAVKAAAGMRVEDFSDPLFDLMFLDSYASTALTTKESCAESGLLHETEFLAPFTRSVNGSAPHPVHVTGDLWVWRDGLPGWSKALPHLRFGGERGYGWGKVEIEDCTEVPRSANENDILTASESDGPVLRYSGSNVRTRAHVPCSSAGDHVHGHVEAVVGWERNNTGGNPWRVSAATLCYAPCALVRRETRFRVEPFGFWRVLPSQ